MGISRTRRRLFERDGRRCKVCGVEVYLEVGTGDPQRLATVGHIVPRAFGGTRYHDNIQLECSKCNNEKGSTFKGEIRPGIYVEVTDAGICRQRAPHPNVDGRLDL